MKIVYTVIIIPLVFVLMGGNLLSFLHFKANQDTLARTVCLYKNVPEKMCYATCVLETSLSQGFQQDMQSNSMAFSWFVFSYTDQDSKLYNSHEIMQVAQERQAIAYERSLYSRLFISTIEHPPRLS